MRGVVVEVCWRVVFRIGISGRIGHLIGMLLPMRLGRLRS